MYVCMRVCEYVTESVVWLCGDVRVRAHKPNVGLCVGSRHLVRCVWAWTKRWSDVPNNDLD